MMPSHLMLLSSGARNLLPNSVWAGGGAAPTGWSGASTGTSTPSGAAPDGKSTAYRQTATAQRPYIAGPALNVAASAQYTLSVYIDTVYSGTFTVLDIVSWVSFPAGAAISYLKNDAVVGSNSPVASGDRIGCVLTTAGTAGTSIPRTGVGINANFTGDLLMSRPQVVAGASMRRYTATY